MTIHYDQFIDAKGTRCPQPLLLAKQGIKQINSKQVILLEATDPHTDLDLEVWCERFGHKIISTEVQDNVYRFWIEKTVP
ncbi:MAG: sulfurtransferase TusA family protein [Alcanivoracaceae bacterium]|nr:sulfurtransferase TusA family protein [Alcanivoracaceae bacterium]